MSAHTVIVNLIHLLGILYDMGAYMCLLKSSNDDFRLFFSQFSILPVHKWICIFLKPIRIMLLLV